MKLTLKNVFRVIFNLLKGDNITKYGTDFAL